MPTCNLGIITSTIPYDTFRAEDVFSAGIPIFVRDIRYFEKKGRCRNTVKKRCDYNNRRRFLNEKKGLIPPTDARKRSYTIFIRVRLVDIKYILIRSSAGI